LHSIKNASNELSTMDDTTSNKKLLSTEEASSSGFLRGGQFHMSPRFTDISPLRESPKNPCRLFKAKRMGKWCVLKCLQPEYAGNPEYATLLQKEFEIGYKFSHPNIVQIISMEEVEGLGACIVMEYIDGRTLTKWAEERPRTREEVAEVMRNIGNVLDYIHQQQVIHRDIKPSNILITRNGDYVKIIDFGLADADNYAILKQPAGTQRYIAPEQLESNVQLDGRADIYSFGVMLADINKSLRHPSRHLRNIAKKCSQPDRERRYSALSEIRWRSRYRHVWKAAATTLLLLLLLFMAYWMGGIRHSSNQIETKSLPGKPTSTSAQAPSVHPSGNKSIATTKQADANTMAVNAPENSDATGTKVQTDDLEESIRKATRDELEFYIRKIAAGDTHVVTDSVLTNSYTQDSNEHMARLDKKIRAIVNSVVSPGSKDYVILLGSANNIMHDEQTKFLTNKANLDRIRNAYDNARKIRAKRMQGKEHEQ
jgi:serine/threonine protein kinase